MINIQSQIVEVSQLTELAATSFRVPQSQMVRYVAGDDVAWVDPLPLAAL